MKTKPSTSSRETRRDVAVPAARPKIKKILATTDFSEESRAGVRYAAALADKLGAAVALIHVIEPLSRMAGMESAALVHDDAKLAALARAELNRIVKRESKGDLPLAFSVRTGSPFHEVAMGARERGADLIVIATHGRTGARRLLLGSTAERVVRHAPCSVLTVPAVRTPGRSALTLKKILVPFDFSRLSAVALPWATALATQFGAEIIFIHVVEKFPVDYLLGPELANETLTPLMKKAEADLERLGESVRKSTGLRASAVIGCGTPFDEICRAAKKTGADLIVLTTHGYTGLKHVWLGSTAERVVRHATCPVLVARERD